MPGPGTAAEKLLDGKVYRDLVSDATATSLVAVQEIDTKRLDRCLPGFTNRGMCN